MQKLRRPEDKLADCVWLPRFIDKTRHHLAGSLPADYIMPYCHPLATDGAFLTHFGISQNEIIAAIKLSAGDDERVARWFQSRPGYHPESVRSWNALAPNLGKEGYPVRRGFLFMLKTYYGGTPPDSRVDSAFTAIAYDEGFLDQVV